MAEKNFPEIPRIAVGVLVCNDKDQIFLARSHKWDNRWIVPGGHLEWGETLHHCAKREVKEETNLEIDGIELVDIQESIFSEEFHERRHMIFMDFSAKLKGGEVKLNEELQEHEWLSPQDALKKELNSSTKQFIKAFIAKNGD